MLPALVTFCLGSSKRDPIASVRLISTGGHDWTRHIQPIKLDLDGVSDFA